MQITFSCPWVSCLKEPLSTLEMVTWAAETIASFQPWSQPSRDFESKKHWEDFKSIVALQILKFFQSTNYVTCTLLAWFCSFAGKPYFAPHPHILICWGNKHQTSLPIHLLSLLERWTLNVQMFFTQVWNSMFSIICFYFLRHILI